MRLRCECQAPNLDADSIPSMIDGIPCAAAALWNYLGANQKRLSIAQLCVSRHRPSVVVSRLWTRRSNCSIGNS